MARILTDQTYQNMVEQFSRWHLQQSTNKDNEAQAKRKTLVRSAYRGQIAQIDMYQEPTS